MLFGKWPLPKKNGRFLLPNKMDYIWYASYGSNLLYNRFMRYIEGGRLEGSSETEQGARDTSPPLKSMAYSIRHELYFAKERSKWGEGGVAFIRNMQNSEISTHSKAYLVTTEQFEDVVCQENQVRSIKVDYELLLKQGYLDLLDNWYGRLLLVGFKESLPIVTFTAPLDWSAVEENRPSQAYESVILKGLQELGLSRQRALAYLTSRYPE